MFRGIYSDAKDVDCLLVFDGQRFRLEQLSGAVKGLRNVRQASIKPPPSRTPSKPPAPSPAKQPNPEAITLEMIDEGLKALGDDDDA